MGSLKFYTELVLPNTELYLLCLLMSGLFSLFLHIKFAKSIIDPLCIAIWSSAFANSVPLFLFFVGECRKELFLFFIISEICFWIGVALLFTKSLCFKNRMLRDEGDIEVKLFWYFFFIYVLSQLVIFAKFGIPLFMYNRNDTFRDSGGWGLITYFVPYMLLYIQIFTFDRLGKDNKKKKYVFCLIIIFLFLFLSGSKSSVLTFVYAYFFYSYFYKKKRPKIKKKYLLLLPLYPILMLASKSGDFQQAWADFINRVIAFGDVYYMAYPDDVINSVKVSDPFLHMFAPILRTLRLVNYPDGSATPLGTLVQYTMNYKLELLGETSAPNTRIPIAAWIYFKWYGVLLAFLVGLVVSFMINVVKRFFHHTIIGISFYGLVYSSALNGCSDLPGFMVSFVTILMCAFMLLIFLILFTRGKVFVVKNEFCKLSIS